MRRLALLGWLAACAPPEPQGARVSACVPELPEGVTSRAKQVVCSDELTTDDAQRGDWLLENQLQRLYFRAEDFSLSKPGRAGGTLLDLGADVDVAEVVPLLPQADGSLDWFRKVRVTPVESSLGAGLRLHGHLPDGTEAELLWWLPEGSARLEVHGSDTLDVVPLANSSIRGDLLVYGQALVSPGRATEVEGGRFRWVGSPWLEPSSETDLHEVLPARYAQPIAGWCDDGEVFYTRDDAGRLLHRGGVDPGTGTFTALTDRRATEVICLATGRNSSGWQPLPAWEEADDHPEEVDLTVGTFGRLAVHITDLHGAPLPSMVWWNGGRWTLNGGEGDLSVGGGLGDGLVGAGPDWSMVELPAQDIDPDSAVRVVLERATPEDALLADFFVEAWPHPGTLSSASSEVARVVSQGVDWAVTVGDHVVVATDVARLNRDDIWSASGARAPTAHGTITSWPWGFDARKSLWGAPDTTGRGPHDALALMGGGRGLTTIVDPTWVEAAGPPGTWPVVPDALHLRSLDDLPVYFELLDQWTSLALVGPRTWLDGVDRRTMAQVDAERALLEHRTMATTGPFVRLRIDGHAPGGQVLPALRREAELTIDAPLWMPVDHAALLGPEGEVVVQWDLGAPVDARRLDTTVRLPDDLPWVVAVAWSDRTAPPLQEVPPWTVTSAIFLDRP